jgi:hypothetical protein
LAFGRDNHDISREKGCGNAYGTLEKATAIIAEVKNDPF